MRIENTSPTIVVIFGVTGDLMAKKIAPALFHLFRAGELPERFHLAGVSRRDWTDDDLRNHLRHILQSHGQGNDPAVKKFLAAVTYHKLTFHEQKDYVALKGSLKRIDDAWGQCSNKLFYLSVPPQFYGEIFDNIHDADLHVPCADLTGWSRIVVEKPFGRDEASAKRLDETLAKLFDEDQVYRIDHYLAKEMLQNVLVFRFGNNLFEDVWDGDHIERIVVRMHERGGVEERGDSYDGVGALRDVGQNHVLSMLGLVAMEAPHAYDPAGIRQARLAALQQLKIFSEKEAATHSKRAQYEGFRQIEGVASDSETETAFRIEGVFEGGCLRGVPFLLESGKRLAEEKSEIEVIFRHREDCLCPSDEPHATNRILIRAKPDEKIIVTLYAKKPGYSLEPEARELAFDFREGRGARQTEDYEKLLLDCIGGDQTLFLSSEEIAAMWRFIDPFLQAWEKGLVPIASYRAGDDLFGKMV